MGEDISIPILATPKQGAFYTTRATCLGKTLVAWSAEGVLAILVGDSEEELTADLRRRYPEARTAEPDAVTGPWVEEIVHLFENPGSGSPAPLVLQGTVFQRRVWRALQEIPCGQTVSYAQVARMIGSPTSTRAVAGACAANWHAVAIPCHRVVRSDGNLSGYRWGVSRKRLLLEREAALDKGVPNRVRLS